MTRYFLVLVISVGLLLFPLPPSVLDAALLGHLGLSMLAIGLAIQLRDPVNCTPLPGLLLATILLRLAVNLATTRVLLFHLPLGSVIPLLGAGLVGDRLSLGILALPFLASVLVLFIPAKLDRVAMLAACYSLDFGPGLAMQIEADGFSGNLPADEVQARQREIHRRSDYFGSMDSLQGILIADSQWAALLMGVNLVGALLWALHGPRAELSEVLLQAITQTVGLAVLATLSALLTTHAMTLAVTRTAVQLRMSRAFFRGSRFALMIVVFLLATEAARLWRASFFLSWPLLVFSLTLHLMLKSRHSEMKIAQPPPDEPTPPRPLVVELTLDLWRGAGSLPDEFGRLRRQLAEELGFVLPDPALSLLGAEPAGHYLIRVAGREVVRGQGDLQDLVWALGRVARHHAADLLQHQDVERLLKHVPKNVALDSGEIHAVLQSLLREGLSIRPLGVILACLEQSRDPEQVSQTLRTALRGTLCQRFAPGGKMRAFCLGEEVEGPLLQLWRNQPQVFQCRPALARQLLRTLSSRFCDADDCVLLTCPELRPALSQLTRASLPGLVLLSRQDIAPGTLVELVPLVG